MSVELMEIIAGISQVMAKTFDGAKDEDGKPIKIGLRREKGEDFHKFNGTQKDCRVLDAFKARAGVLIEDDEAHPCVHVTYVSEISQHEAHEGHFEDEMEHYLGEAVKYLKKEFKKVTGKELSLAKHGETEVTLEQTSRIRILATAKSTFKISGKDLLPTVSDKEEESKDETLEKWLALGGLKK